MESKTELTYSRLFGAPKELVYKAWTDEKLLAQWWGPRLFSAPVCTIDLKVGGSIHIDMKGPDGVVYPMGGSYEEIIPNEKLVFIGIAAEDEKGNPLLATRNTVTFEDFNGMTCMTLHVEVIKRTAQMEGALSGMEQGWSESLYKLGEVIDKS